MSSSSASASVVDRLFEALRRADASVIDACYHPQISYSDSVFEDLRGARVALRWRMLLQQADGFSLEHGLVFADERKAQVQWTADYRLRGKRIRVPILSTLAIWDDLIVRQVDEYNFWQYSRQAQGIPGLLLGGLEPFQKIVRRRARRDLERFATSVSS